jgi:anti-anti-sigma factor
MHSSRQYLKVTKKIIYIATKDSDIMNIEKNYDGKELTLSVEGRIDTITSQELNKEIDDESGNFDSLIIDFTDLEYISSAGLRVLIATQKKLKADDIPFVITNVNNQVNNIFRMSGFDKILKIE